MDDQNISPQQNSNYPSSTGTDSYAQGPGSGADAQQFSQGQGGGYDNMQQSGQDDMGGGRGAMGSGVSGGYEGNQSNQQGQQGQQNQQGQGQTQEKQDWLDKGLTMMGKKAGMNVSGQQADSAGDFINKEVNQHTGRKLPGVQ